MWALGVAATNAYIIYERCYEEEKKKHKEMPTKWTHMQFLEELIHDFVGWAPVNVEAGNDSVATTTRTTRRGSSYSSVASQEHFFDLTTEEGREDFFLLSAPISMTKKRMEDAYFSARFDGQFHPFLPVKQVEAYCQYCYYRFNNELNEEEKQVHKKMKKNRDGIQRCLTCRVNLFWECRNLWHGIPMEVVNSMVSCNGYLDR